MSESVLTRIPLVWIILGSVSDAERMKEAEQTLNVLTIPSEVYALSAHRTPDDVSQLARSAKERGVEVIIAAAGGAAHLPGVIAANTDLPVVGVPISGKEGLGGLDALLSIAQMPPGVPVGTMSVNGAKNAALFSARIVAAKHPEYAPHLKRYREKMADEVRAKNKQLHALGISSYLATLPPKK